MRKRLALDVGKVHHVDENEYQQHDYGNNVAGGDTQHLIYIGHVLLLHFDLYDPHPCPSPLEGEGKRERGLSNRGPGEIFRNMFRLL
jgi:hypothetical protein